MVDVLSGDGVTGEQNRRISETIAREQARLRRFIRSRVPDSSEAEDIFQEVVYELIAAYRLMKPIEQVGAWLVRVARNRIIDRFRKNRPALLGNDAPPLAGHEGENSRWEDLLPSPEDGPDAAYARTVLLEELDAALEELPREQRDVFVAHELEGRSFKELSEETGVNVNTLLSRKHYAVLQLRRRLEAIYKEFKNIEETE
jgi:RNA polymerase sigma factor (sigma-70 family)